MQRLALLASTAVLAAATALPAMAQFARPDDAIKYRQSAFFVMGQHFGRIGAMVNNRAPFDAQAAAQNAEIVQAMSRLPFAGFVDGTDRGGTTRALPRIWTERARFDAAAARMQEEAARLAVAARTGDVAQLRTAFGAAAQSCKACHDNFRRE
jgi:cytochrome c556